VAEADDLEVLAGRLEASGRYRVLRRLERFTRLSQGDLSSSKRGIVLDLETTGVDPRRDEIIEVAMVPFQYDADGQVLAVGEAFSRLRQPREPISDEITRITGITDAMVAGQVIDPAEIAAFAAPAALIIAHNASFDRRFAEAFCPSLAMKGWAC
jgi:DNA polymerase-3 subunit epsilon